MKNFKAALLALVGFVVIPIVVGLLLAVTVGCTTTDKTMSAATQIARTAAQSYYDYYHLETNAHPEKATFLTRGVTNVFNASKGLSLAIGNYKAISQAYQTNKALEGSYNAAITGVNLNRSNLLYLITYFRK